MYLASEIVFYLAVVFVWCFGVSSVVNMWERQKRRRHKTIRRLPL